MIPDALKVPLQDEATVTTDVFVGFPESVMKHNQGHNWFQYLVENDDGANTVDAIVRGRFVFADGNRPWVSRWVDVGVDQQIPPNDFATFQIGPLLQFDEYAIFIKSTAAGNPAGVFVYGTAKRNPDASTQAALIPAATQTVGETVQTTTVSFADVPIGAMALTVPVDGDYIARWSGTIWHNFPLASVLVNIQVNGAIRPESDRWFRQEDDSFAVITPGATETSKMELTRGDIVAPYWRVSIGTGSLFTRTFILQRIQ